MRPQVVPHGDYPLMPVGKLVLNRMVDNYFMETEQVGRPLAEPHAFLPLMAASVLATLMNCLVVRPPQ